MFGPEVATDERDGGVPHGVDVGCLAGDVAREEPVFLGNERKDEEKEKEDEEKLLRMGWGCITLS